jgi:parallel beta-helix repeat protein
VRRIILPGLSAAALVAAALAVPASAQAASTSTTVTCGQTLTTSVRLTHDLVDCRGDGLVIGADDITVDLNGHTVSGRNAPGSEGVADDGHQRLTVRGGRIQGFFLNGIGLRHAPHSSVRNLRIRKIGAGGVEGDASAGVLLDHSPHSMVTGSTITNDVSAYQSDGVDVLSSAAVTVRGNTIARNSWDGMAVISSPWTTVVGNALDGNQNQGIEVNAASDHTVLTRNHARNNVSDGLVVGAVSDAVIEDNTLTGNGDSGVFMFDLLNSRISDNRASGNGVGINLDGGQHGSRGNQILKNDTSHNLAVGLVVSDRADRNTVSGNVSDANQGAPGEGGGIILEAVTGNRVRDNVANGNLDVGIGIFEDSPGDAAGNVLTGNTANRNHGHGIDAVHGTVDGGHNAAHHNTPRPNCLGVVCS